ncbi:MAG TPA: hypothetical protein VMF62_17470 [Acetobacteraceae bacterium]|nr:hypothetical protein [Acetobacteraceae bacterium]
MPAGVTAVSVQQQEFTPDRFGIITVPNSLGQYLLGLGVGFVAATERPPPTGSPPTGSPPTGSLVGAAAPRSSSTLTVADLRRPTAGPQRAGVPGGRDGDPVKGRRQG